MTTAKEALGAARAEVKINAYLDAFRSVYGGKVQEPVLNYNKGWVTMYHYRTTRRMRLAELDELIKRGESFLK